MPNKTSFFNQSGLAGVDYSAQAFDSSVGEALNYVRLNTAETSMEFRTPEEVRADLDLEIGVDVQAYDAALPTGSTILVDADIGLNVEAYDATILKDADIGSTVQAYDATIVVDADIGVSVQAYDATILVDADIGVNVEAYDATILKDADIGVTVQAYDATYLVDANIGVNVEAYDATILKDADIGVTVQAYDASLLSLAALATGADKMPYTTAANVYAETTLTVAGRNLIDDASTTAQRTTLGLGTAAVVNTGVNNGNVPLMDAIGYPAADGSQITGISSVSRGQIDGLILSNNTTDALNDIDISAGEAADDGQNAVMILAAITKRLDASWVVGTNQGGLDGTESVTGTPDANTWYHCWLIRRSDTGVVDVLFSESATGPTMPTNYDQKRRIGAVLFDATPDIVPFHQNGDKFSLKTRVENLDDTTPSTAGVLLQLTTPLGVETEAIIGAWVQDTTAIYVIFTAEDEVNVAAGATNADIGGGDAQPGSFNEVVRKTNTSSQIRYRSSQSAVSNFHVTTRGWIDPRGRNA